MEYYEQLLFGFIEKLNTLEKVLPSTLSKLAQEATVAYEDFEKFIREKCTIENETADDLEYEVPIVEIRNYKEKKARAEDLLLTSMVVGKSYIVSLVSQYDQFFAQLLTTIYKSRPELVQELGKTIAVADLSKFESVDDIVSDVIAKEIDSIMREGHLAQIEYLEKKIKGDIKADRDLLKKFVELTERRNLFVHTDGIISKQYLETCKREGYTLKEEYKVGYQLEADPSYFYSAVSTLNEFAVKLVAFVLKKLHPDQSEPLKDLIIHGIYKNLEFRNFSVVRNLVKYSSKICSLNRSELLIVSVNNVLSYYLADKVEEAKKHLDQIDWSDASDRFRLARQVILEDFPGAVKVMKRIGNEKDSDVTEIDYHQWPLFFKFRSSPEFREAYKEVYGREFDSVEQNNVAVDVIVVSQPETLVQRIGTGQD